MRDLSSRRSGIYNTALGTRKPISAAAMEKNAEATGRIDQTWIRIQAAVARTGDRPRLVAALDVVRKGYLRRRRRTLQIARRARPYRRRLRHRASRLPHEEFRGDADHSGGARCRDRRGHRRGRRSPRRKPARAVAGRRAAGAGRRRHRRCCLAARPPHRRADHRPDRSDQPACRRRCANWPCPRAGATTRSAGWHRPSRNCASARSKRRR